MANIDNEDLVSTYFYLQKRIDRTRERIEEYEQDFNNKNFYTCIQERYEQMTTVAFRLEKEVTDHVAAIEMAEQHIKTLQFKLKHFNRFMSVLCNSDKEYYTSRYKHDNEALNDRLDNLIFDEVKEIEEAAKHCFKVYDESIYNHKEEWRMRDVKILSDFNKMSKLLGV